MRGTNIANEDRAALQAQAQDWLVRLTSGQATAGDAQAFKAWCGQSAAHAEVMAEATRVWGLSRPAAQALARRLPAAARYAHAPAVTHRRFGRRAFFGGALAAGVAAYAVVRPPAQLWPALSDMTADYRTGTGEQRQVVLSDAVVVEMNTQTSFNLLRADADGSDPVALELLTGEAQVMLRSTPSTPLRVTAGGGELLASIATQFNIRVTATEVCVTCIAGSVELSHGGRTQTARADQQVVYGEGAMAMSAVPDLSTVTAWRERVLVFDNVPLSTAVEEINRYRPGRIIVTSAELGRRKVQARLRLDQLADVAELLHASYDARVTTLPAGILLIG